MVAVGSARPIARAHPRWLPVTYRSSPAQIRRRCTSARRRATEISSFAVCKGSTGRAPLLGVEAKVAVVGGQGGAPPPTYAPDSPKKRGGEGKVPHRGELLPIMGAAAHGGASLGVLQLRGCGPW